jgi:hypothetical protein
MNRKGEASARANALDEFVDRIRRERAAAFRGEDLGRARRLQALLAERTRVSSLRNRCTLGLPPLDFRAQVIGQHTS